MAISDDQKFLLNNKMGSIARKVQLGTLIENAEEGGLAAGSVDTTELAADAVTNAKIEDGAVSLEHLDAAIAPAFIPVAAGEFTTAGGDATESITSAGVVATDIVLVTLHTVGSTPRTILTALAVTDAITVTMSGDPSTDHVLSYVVLRAAA